VKKLYYTWEQFDKDTSKLAIQILKSGWQPDYIVGIVRGGLVVATTLSHKMDTFMYTLDVRLRDTVPDYAGPTQHLWMQEDAIKGKKILIVDDINDSGATFQWIKDHWDIKTIQNGNVRFATLFDHLGSGFEFVEYTVNELNTEDKPWVVFPWEDQ
jgi:hypoxanthine phosphoribosyltransferase